MAGGWAAGGGAGRGVGGAVIAGGEAACVGAAAGAGGRAFDGDVGTTGFDDDECACAGADELGLECDPLVCVAATLPHPAASAASRAKPAADRFRVDMACPRCCSSVPGPAAAVGIQGDTHRNRAWFNLAWPSIGLSSEGHRSDISRRKRRRVSASCRYEGTAGVKCRRVCRRSSRSPSRGWRVKYGQPRGSPRSGRERDAGPQ
jgi:hypothetical protein